MRRFASLFVFAAAFLSAGGFLTAQTVFVNQAGYLPKEQKLVYFSSPTNHFSVVDAKSGGAVFKGTAALLSSNDPATGLSVYIGDFSELTKEGTYRVVAENGVASCAFAVSPAAFSDVFRKSLKGYYFQRCGTALSPQYAGSYARSACHPNDAVFHASTGKTGSLPTTGGWHDAGDYGKYVINAGISVGTLLMAYEQFPVKFKADDLNIPESGNAVPDILDEVRYELDWLLEMQDPSDGGVYFKVTTEKFDAFEMPSDDNATRYVYQKSTAAAGDFAAVTAMAARIYAPFDRALSAKCLAAAEKAWRYLEANPGIVPRGGFTNPPGTDTGAYGDGNDADERLWAAAELFVTTGGDPYHAYFKKHFAEGGIIVYVMGWQDVRALAQLEYLIDRKRNPDAETASAIRNALIKRCTSLASVSAADGFNVVLTPAEYYWGSNSVALNDAVLLIFGYQVSGNKEFYNVALKQLNYILGCNMHNMTFVTGTGSASPRHIHHRPSGADGIVEPIPGLLSGGPNRNLEDGALKAHFTKSTPPAACYLDDQGSYASNEICLNWNAPLVLVAGFFNQ
jgi:endoglucanase